MAKLEQLDEQRTIATHNLLPGRNIVGRDDRCSVCLPDHPDSLASRRHCIITVAPEHTVVVDVSTNGTRLDGRTIPPHRPVVLRDGAELGIADLRFRYVPTRRARPKAETRGDFTFDDAAPIEAEHLGDLVAVSPTMKAVFSLVRRLAPNPHSVLITGESGTGKELVARAIHAHSDRHDGPFVALNAAAIQPSLFASQLFGHEPGAFTDARTRADGAFHAAHGGTLFLDEIGELSLDLQSKLLRVLETGEVVRVGATTAERPNVRVLAATHRNLPAMVAEGAFRHDLHYRLDVLSVVLPPLRARPEDVGVIAERLLTQHHPGLRLSAAALHRLSRHPWPGNVRELRNALVRASLHDRNGVLGPEAFEELAPAAPPDALQARIEAAYRQTASIGVVARAVGRARSTVRYRLKKAGLVD